MQSISDLELKGGGGHLHYVTYLLPELTMKITFYSGSTIKTGQLEFISAKTMNS